MKLNVHLLVSRNPSKLLISASPTLVACLAMMNTSAHLCTWILHIISLLCLVDLPVSRWVVAMGIMLNAIMNCIRHLSMTTRITWRTRILAGLTIIVEFNMRTCSLEIHINLTMKIHTIIKFEVIMILVGDSIMSIDKNIITQGAITSTLPWGKQGQVTIGDITIYLPIHHLHEDWIPETCLEIDRRAANHLTTFHLHYEVFIMMYGHPVHPLHVNMPISPILLCIRAMRIKHWLPGITHVNERMMSSFRNIVESFSWWIMWHQILFLSVLLSLYNTFLVLVYTCTISSSICVRCTHWWAGIYLIFCNQTIANGIRMDIYLNHCLDQDLWCKTRLVNNHQDSHSSPLKNVIQSL